ncbi:hypothetical protein KFK09_025576 [Dendrobium nobile]|uniref:Nucleolar pre-ribosomal-associated protein 1 C-terminal domain-containing protein n=1 Tax=Dendrobium nobile TaxID=94219 RepID=A0A8T3A4C5_DENNO|nr:hypothetical protein KFK09_025576 [Dendrobium nobile]
MSFLEAGNPRLLRWILQQKEMYYGVLRGLANDDTDTIIFVLSALHDKLLKVDSLVSPALRSVLFGSATLEQLSFISGNPLAGPAANVAHDVLVIVCTNPQNGLMPGPGLKGNKKRLLDLMKKLKGTEVAHHKQLLLAIVKKEANLCSAYLNEFPYHLEPRSSSSWFSAISLAADLVSTINIDSIIASKLGEKPATSIEDLHETLKCIIPRVFTRSMINKGLLHSDDLVKHGSLRFILELLKSLDDLLTSLDIMIQRTVVRQEADFCVENMASMHNFPGLNYFVPVDEHLDDDGIASFPSDEVLTQHCVALKHYIQNEIRAELPDPQVLLKLLSSSSASFSGLGVKRPANFPNSGLKKQKLDEVSENLDIFVSGLDKPLANDIAGDSLEAAAAQISEVENDHFSVVYEIWGLPKKGTFDNKLKDLNSFFQSKLLDVLKIYLRTMPIAFEGSFDFFKILPANPSSLSIDHQRSLLSLLVECIQSSSQNRISAGLLYKHLYPLINFLIFSQVKDIKSQAYALVRAAMISTGAFDKDLSEIDAWFVFLPVSVNNINADQSQRVEALCNQSAIVVSFLCEAVSTIGNNLYKHLDQIRKLLSAVDVYDHSVTFSPLVICILQKCLRLLESDSETLKLHESSLISLYVGNTLRLIMQSQVDMRTLPSLIYMLLYEIFEDHSSADDNPRNSLCEWRPLKNLFGFACNILDEQVCVLHSISGYNFEKSEDSFSSVLADVEELLRHAQGERVDGLAVAFTSSILCAAPDDILVNLPSILAIMQRSFPTHLPFLSSVFFQEPKLLVNIRELWPKMFISGFELINQAVDRSYGGDVGYEFSSNEPILATNLDSMEFSASAFCFFLKHSPFYVLLPSILSFATWESHSTGIQEVFPSNKMLELLKVKVSEDSIDDSILHLKYVLFWTYRMFLLYKEKQSDIISELLLMCITVVQDLMDHLLAVMFNQADFKVCYLSSVGQYAQFIVELIFCHPIVTLYISNPLYFSRKFTTADFGISLDSFLTTFKQNIHSIDQCMLQLLRKLFEFLFVLSGAISSSEIHNFVWESLIRVKNTLIQKILLAFREEFELLVVSKNTGRFLAIFYTFLSLMEFISLFDLLDLVHWMFCKIESNFSDDTSPLEYAVSVGLYIADGSLDMLYSLLQESTSKFKSNIFLEGLKSFDASLVPKIFYKIINFSLCFHLNKSDICLLKTVNVVYNHRRMKPSNALLPLHVLLSSMIFSIPVKMLIYCINSISKINAKTVLLLTEVSPIHMRLFGKIFLAILDNSLSAMDVSNAGVMRPCRGKMTSNSKDCFSNDDLLLLLPVALSYFVFSLEKHGEQGFQPFMKIPLTYANILLDGFSTWDAFVSQEIFQEDVDEFSPHSLEEFNKFCCNSLIGKAIGMLHYFFVLNGSSVRWKKRLRLFDSICPQSSFFDGRFCCGDEGLDACSYKESLKVINEVVAKISFMRLLLFSLESSIQSMGFLEDESVKRIFMGKESGQLNQAKLRFMNILINTLDHIWKQFPLKVDSSVAGCATNCYVVFRFLENLILKEIVKLSKEMHSYLIEISSFSFANSFIRSSLLHRFEDHATLRGIRCFLVALSGSKFSFGDVLELLIGHSAFVKIILSNLPISDSSVFSSAALLQPLNSVLKLVDVSCSLQNIRHNEPSPKVRRDCYSVEDVKLEVVRLLRILFHLRDGTARMGCFNSKELLSLLLCGYSATQSQIDLEILHLMQEIESLEGPDNVNLEALDYMWGVAALKMRKEKTHDILLPSNRTSDCETIEERKIHFRENIPVDSKVCAVTVLHLCNDGSSRIALSLESLLEDATIKYPKIVASSGKDIIQPYDPSFMLRFSIHSLSMGYLEPVEFSRLGLLAVTFASISSSDGEVRRLGYDCLGRFKICLEKCRKGKDLLQLLLLLTYLQNGITEAWQEIPSVFAIFAAEASLTLLDHSQNYFLTISKFLMRFPRVNLKAIPLFHTLFGSRSIHFSTERLWILRLLCAGLNSPDDAKLYLRNNVLDVLLSYSSSSLADDEFKILTLMIIKKCVQLHMLADLLVKEFGLLPWLSSLLLFYVGRLIGHQEERSSVDIVKLILEVVNDVVSSGMVSEWLQDCALEQLSEFSLLLLQLFVGSVKLLKEDISLVHAMLTVITSTMRLSQKRNIYQPHFTLSLECLLQLFQAVNVKFGNLGHTIELGMNAILMAIPTPVASQVHKAKLMKLLTWAAPAVLWSNVNKKFLTKDLNSALMILSVKEQIEESLASKLLRWVSASVILGTVLSSHSEVYASSRMYGNENMLSYLKGISMNACAATKNSSVVNESLAVLILHLQDFLSRKCVLPSVVSALSVLLLSAASSGTGTVKEYLDDNYGTIQSLCSKIRFPAETNPAWRWSFDQPWKDPSLNKSEMELMEEEHACQSLHIIFSNAIGVGKAQGFPALCVEDVENLGLFQWEKEVFAGFRNL